MDTDYKAALLEILNTNGYVDIRDDGCVTIDTGYDGEAVRKAVLQLRAEGLLKDDFWSRYEKEPQRPDTNAWEIWSKEPWYLEFLEQQK